MKKYAALLFLTPCLCLADVSSNTLKRLETLQTLAATLQCQKDIISLKDGLATVTLPDSFRYPSSPAPTI